MQCQSIVHIYQSSLSYRNGSISNSQWRWTVTELREILFCFMVFNMVTKCGTWVLFWNELNIHVLDSRIFAIQELKLSVQRCSTVRLRKTRVAFFGFKQASHKFSPKKHIHVKKERFWSVRLLGWTGNKSDYGRRSIVALRPQNIIQKGNRSYSRRP